MDQNESILQTCLWAGHFLFKSMFLHIVPCRGAIFYGEIHGLCVSKVQNTICSSKENTRDCLPNWSLNNVGAVINVLFHFFLMHERPIVGCLVLSALPAFHRTSHSSFCMAYRYASSCKIIACETLSIQFYSIRNLGLLKVSRGSL